MKFLIVLLVSLYHVCDGARILGFFPFPGKSHQATFQPIVRGLCEKGHQVTFVSPFQIDDLSSNCSQITIGNFIQDIQRIVGMDEGYGAQIANQQSNVLWTALSLRKIGFGLAELTFKDANVKQLISSDQKFDLILLETTFFQEAFIAFQHRFNAPVVEILPPSNSHWTYFLYGNPYDTTYIVDIFNRFRDEMNFQERLINTVSSVAVRALYMVYHMPKTQALMDKHFKYPGWESRPPLMDMLKNSSLLLMNSHIALNYPYPLSPNVKEIGGVHLLSKRNPLPKDLQDFMDTASDGIIYFTFGSHIQVSSTLGDRLKNEFLKAFAKIKQRVLWKWEKDFPNVPSNVKISKWFPQQDILAHKNVKLFISHGGLLSITEAVVNGIPIVGVPILGDQPKNVRHMTHFGYGLGLDFNNLTEKSIYWAIREVIDNPRYQERSMAISKLLKDNPQSPLEKAVFWIEYVLRNNGAYHLRPAVTRLAWYQQAMIDIYLALALISLLPIIIFYVLIQFLIKCFQAKWTIGSRGKRKTKNE